MCIYIYIYVYIYREREIHTLCICYRRFGAMVRAVVFLALLASAYSLRQPVVC